MSRLVLGADDALARALTGGEPPVPLADATRAIADGRPREIVLVSRPRTAGPVGALPTDALADLLDGTVSAAFSAARAAADAGGPIRLAVVAPAGAVLPDHRDGARSVAAAGIAMLVEICAATDGLAANVVAVADDVPAEAVAGAVEFALAQPALNGATIRLDGGRDAVLAADTRAEGD